MAALIDKLSTSIALKAFNALVDNAGTTGAAKTAKNSELLQVLEEIKSVVSRDSARPLEVKLSFPSSCTTAKEAIVNHLQSQLPTERELVSLQHRAKRLVALVENILVQHELLAKEAIHTLRTIRMIAKWTSISLTGFLLYFYVRKFYGSSTLYKILMERRLTFAILLSCVSLGIYCYYDKRMCLKSIANIS